jgi:hypothetical protein
MQAVKPTEETPSRWRDLQLWQRVLAVWFLSSSVVGIWYFLGDPGYFVSPNYYQAFLWPALTVGVAAYVASYRMITTKSGQPLLAWARAKKLPFPTFSAYLGVPLFVIGTMGYVPFVVCAPCVLMKVFGEPYRASLTVSRTERESSRFDHCYRIFPKELKEYWFGKICVSEEAFQAIESGDVIGVEGTQSWFGIHVIEYKYRRKPLLRQAA